MPIAKISVEVDQDQIKEYMNEEMDEAYREVMFTWDINEMSIRLWMGRTFLEEEFLHDPRMRLVQRQKGRGKRFLFYEPSLMVINEIMDSWE